MKIILVICPKMGFNVNGGLRREETVDFSPGIKLRLHLPVRYQFVWRTYEGLVRC
jgi:hypothetical protein